MKSIIQNYRNLSALMDNPINFLDNMASNGSEIQRVAIGPKKFVLVFCPDIAREILIRRSSIYIQNRSIFDKIKPLTGANGLVQLEGESSKKARFSARSIFSTQGVQRSTAIIKKNCEKNFSKLTTGSEIEPSKLMTELVLENALEIFLGVENKCTQKTMGEVFLKLHELCGKRMLNPFALPLSIPLKKNLKVKKLSSKLKKQVSQHLNNSSPFPEGSIPHALKDHPNIVDHCMTFLFAGHETTASSLAFTLLLLAQDSEGQGMVFDGNENEIISVYKESLRLYPPAYMLVRQTVQDDKLESIKVQKGDQIIIGLKQILSSNKYFSEPQSFKVDRFLNKNSERTKAFFPFGLGGKSCIGEQLAYIEAKVILQQFFKHFKIEIVNKTIDSTPMVTLHPNLGQKIKIKRRLSC